MSQSQTYTGIILYKRNRSGLMSFTKIQLKALCTCRLFERYQNYFDIKWPKFERYNIVFKVILHQFWLKKIFPWKFNLEYGGTFTKLFMHVSSRNMFPTTRNLQIRVHVYQPRHCCWNWLTFGCFVPMIADHDLVKKSFGPMISDHDLVKKR
jgi:hypothetical protein